MTTKGMTLSDDAYATWLEQHTWAPSTECGLVVETELAPAVWLLLAPCSGQL